MHHSKTEAKPVEPGWGIRTVVAALVVLCAVLAVGAVLLLRHSKRQAVALWEHRLSAIADDRQAAIGAWLDFSLADAQEIASYPGVLSFLTESAGQGLPSLQPKETSSDLEAFLSQTSALKQARGVYIVDTQGHMLVQSKGSPDLGPECLSLIERALESRELRVLPFHRNAKGVVTVSFFAPVFSAGDTDHSALLGGVILEIVPYVWQQKRKTKRRRKTF